MSGLLLLSGLLGCASFERRARPPIEPPREGTEWIQGARHRGAAGDPGVRLYFSAKAPKSEPWGVVYFVLGPEIGAADLYPKLTEALHASGVATAILHPRGAGYSDGMRGDIDDYSLFLGDLRLGLDEVRRRFPGKATFLFGHSAGATLALHVAAKAEAPLAGLILVNPAYKMTYGEGMGPSFGDYIELALNMVFRRSALTVDMNRRPLDVKNRADREEALGMQRDPLVVRYFSMRYLLAQREVMRACVTNAAATAAPLLLVQGAEDALVDPRGNDEILAAAKATDKAKLVAPRGAHGSSAAETSVEEILAWLRGHRPR